MSAKPAIGSVLAAVVLAIALSGCGTSAAPSVQPPTVAPNVTVPDAPSESSEAPEAPEAPEADGSGTGAEGKVSANTASEEELVAALTGAGVPNPERWAHEIEEYRPYPADDPNLGKLRAELAKYNPGQETLDKIVSALTP